VISRPAQPRIVITGQGCVTPLGEGVETVWKRLTAGETAFGPIDRFDASTFSTNFAAQAPEPDLASSIADAHRFDGAGLNTKFALAAAAQAWRRSGLGDPLQDRTFADIDARRVGIYLGSGEGVLDFDNYAKSNLAGLRDDGRTMDYQAWARAAYENMDATREIEQEANMTLGHLAEAFDAGGPAYNCLTACTASTQAIGEATEILRRGDAELMLAGGAHTMIHPLGVTGFIRLTALSSRRDDPATASRPFSLNRDGFVMGEGAGMLVLETLDHALARGAAPLAEIIGFGSSADAFRITDIQPDGAGARSSMLEALEEAEIDPAATDDAGRPLIHYISAHGTGTRENDSIETVALKSVFSDQAANIPVSSVKSMLGHLIAAAGAVEAIVCVQAIRTGVLPPTMNLHTPDPACDLDYIRNAARDVNDRGGVRIALSNSFGFGGQNNTLILKRYDE